MHFLQQASRGQSRAKQEVHVIDSFMCNWLLQCFLNLFLWDAGVFLVEKKKTGIFHKASIPYKPTQKQLLLIQV